MMGEKKYLILTLVTLLIIVAGAIFLVYWDMREWHMTMCKTFSCFIREFLTR